MVFCIPRSMCFNSVMSSNDTPKSSPGMEKALSLKNLSMSSVLNTAHSMAKVSPPAMVFKRA